MQRSALISNRTRLSERSRACRVHFSHQDSTQRFKVGSRKTLLRGFYDSLVQRFNSSDINGPKQAVNEHLTAYSTAFDWE